MNRNKTYAGWGIAALTLAAATTGVGSAAQKPAPTLLVVEKGTLTLAVVDPRTLQILSRVPSGPDPHEVVTTADGTRAYISNYGGEGSDQHTISVVDLTERKVLPAIDLGALHSPHGLDFAGGKLYFTAETNKAIGRYDPATQQIDWVLGTGQDRTHMVLAGKDLAHIVTSNVSSGSISLLEESELKRGNGPPPAAGAANPLPPPRKGWRVTSIPSGRGAEGFDVSPDGKQVWAANTLDRTVTVIDLASKAAIQTFAIPVTGANRLKFTLDGKYVLVTGLGMGAPDGSAATSARDSNLAVIDAATHAIVKQSDVGGGSAGILMEPSGERVYIAVTQGNKVAVLDLRTLQVTAQISSLSQPDGLAWATN